MCLSVLLRVEADAAMSWWVYFMELFVATSLCQRPLGVLCEPNVHVVVLREEEPKGTADHSRHHPEQKSPVSK